MNEFAAETEVIQALIEGRPFLDVRAPVEFATGSLPNSRNLPILNDAERHAIGIEFKQKGQDAAVALGHQLVSGDVKDQRIHAWKEFFEHHPNSLLYCFRGGQRSRFAQQWLNEAGIKIKRVQGGYKKYRKFLTDVLETLVPARRFIVLAGRTGSGKTECLMGSFSHLPHLDLEAFANHRGSSFGQRVNPQPSQADFENRLAVEMLRLKNTTGPILIEDESRTIGAVVIPDVLFEEMKKSPVVVIEDSLEARSRRIYREYVELAFQDLAQDAHPKYTLLQNLLDATTRIERKLGGLKCQQVKHEISTAFSNQDFLKFELHKGWIQLLLVHYYDPLYEKGMDRKSDRIVFCGPSDQILKYVSNDNHIAASV